MLRNEDREALANLVMEDKAPDNAGILAAVDTRLPTSGYTAPDNASVTAIKAKTDSLTFTVAGVADSNVAYVNGLAVTGTGTEADAWGP